MAVTHFGLDGGIGSPKTVDYSGKAIVPGQKTYTKTFSRMSIDGGIIRHDRDYTGKVELQPLVEGGVQADSPTIAGVITRTAFRTINGGVQAGVPTLTGGIQTLGKNVSGGVTSQDSTISGTLTKYPLTGWSLTDFTVDYSGDPPLDPDSPFTDPAYSAILTGDKCHHETLTSPDSHTVTMNGLGEFSISPTFVAQPQTFDVQIYDLSDGTLGTISTITIYGADADEDVTGAVQSQDATVTGTLTNFTVIDINGAVQAGLPTLAGLITASPSGNLKLITGNVQSGSSTVSGAIENTITIFGAVQADAPILTGDIKRVTVFSGGVQAENATVTGDLSPPTEDPGTANPRNLKQKFINRKVKWKSRQRKIH